jgi:2-polyprenyl-3-methyl-5-hydroxy-6-metoxy-1,4-benzoquinol methylase
MINPKKTNCFICGGSFAAPVAGSAYAQCRACDHEVLLQSSETGAVDNEALSELNITKMDRLDRFKHSVLTSLIKVGKNQSLLDIGCGSGKFLAQSQLMLEQAVGIEVSPASLEYARQELGLLVIENIDDCELSPDIVTAWHSFEHIPSSALEYLLETLKERMPPEGVILVSVPNNSSYQALLYGSHFAFSDIPNHLHQFSPKSLNLMMQSYDFIPETRFFSTPYSVFGWIQGALNTLTRSHNYLYYRLKRDSITRSMRMDIIHVFLAILISPFALLATAVESLNKDKQGVMTICYRKP